MSGSGDRTVLAAGAVVWRRAADNVEGDVELLVVHRPRYDDWSLPKGKCDPGEEMVDTAIREVQEETGVTGRLGPSLGDVRYTDHKGRPKVVGWWSLEAVDVGDPLDEDEVDEMRWLPAAEARALLTYDTDRGVVDRFLTGLRD